MTTQFAFFSLPPTHCQRCGRLLTARQSISRAIGPICAHRGANKDTAEMDQEFADFTLFDPVVDGIVLRRNETGLWTNVPHIVTHHSPTGFEFGYAGSGPADLALNIVEMLLNRIGYHGAREKCWRGDCYRAAFELHQAFKFQFIATTPREGAIIPYEAVESWVREHLPNTAPDSD